MKIKCSVNGTSSNGKPYFNVNCEHCNHSFYNASHWVYNVCRPKGIEPSDTPKEACVTFEWIANSKRCPKKLKSQLCRCDENPTGIIGAWFKTNSKVIDKYDLDLACDDIRFRALKDGLDPSGSDCKETIKELRKAVKEHNQKIKENKLK